MTWRIIKIEHQPIYEMFPNRRQGQDWDAVDTETGLTSSNFFRTKEEAEAWAVNIEMGVKHESIAAIKITSMSSDYRDWIKDELGD